MLSFSEKMIKGKQHKLDKNKNGKIDAHDFKLLRKEEQDLEEQELDEAKPGLYANINAKRKRIEAGSKERMRKPGSKGAPSASDFKDAAKTANEEVSSGIMYKKKTAKLKEGSVPDHMQGKQKPYVSSDGKGNHEVLGNKGQTKATFTRKEHGSEAKSKAIAHLKSKYNEYMKEDLDAAAKKVVKTNLAAKHAREKESLVAKHEQQKKQMREGLDESHFKLGDTVKCKASGDQGKVVKLDKEDGKDDDKYYTVKKDNGKTMKFAPNELSLVKESAPFDGGTVRKPAKNSDGTVQTPMSRARELAKRALQRKMKKEETEQIDELSKSTLGSYAKKATHDARIQQSIGKDFEADRSRKPGMKAAAKELADKYKSKSRKREAGVGKAIDRLAKEEVELDEKMNLATAKMGDVIKDFQTSDAPQFAGKSKEKRREMAIAAKLEADRGTKKEETEMLSYKEFMMMLEYEPKGGVYRHSGTYGSEYAKKEREKDEQGFDAKDDNQSQKRGRGRPAGAKSGARGPRIK